jgi:hypothetical protein
VFTAEVSFQQGDKGYYAVLNRCKLAPPGTGSANQWYGAKAPATNQRSSLRMMSNRPQNDSVGDQDAT